LDEGETGRRGERERGRFGDGREEETEGLRD